MIDDIFAILLGGTILALIFSLFSYFGSKRVSGDPTFFDRFLKIFLIICFLLLIGLILDKAGCSDDDYDYPMKYNPN